MSEGGRVGERPLRIHVAEGIAWIGATFIILATKVALPEFELRFLFRVFRRYELEDFIRFVRKTREDAPL